MASISTKEIKGRIRSMEATRQITRAMEMVASSRLRHAQQSLLSARPYVETLRQTMDDILASNGELSSPYLSKSPAKKTAYVVIAGDRGLAGGYNGNILKLAAAQMDGRESVVLPIGWKAVEHFRSRGIPPLADSWAEAAGLSADDCFCVARLLCRRYLNGEYGSIHICYTGFASVLSLVPTSLQLLPLEKTAGKKPDVLLEPDSFAFFDAVVPDYLGGILYGALCESRCAELAARRMAMDSATRNAKELIDELRLKFNQARQSAITQEITEIIAGSQGNAAFCKRS